MEVNSGLSRRESTEVEELYSSWTLFIVCVLLILALLTSYYLQIKRIRAVHETVVSIFAGMFVGLVVRLAPGHLIREMLTFSHTLFFNLLLPPIILNSGYELRQDNFFRNFGSILTFAFLGTFTSAVGIGLIVYIWSFVPFEGLNLSPLECLIFGSTLSATDPVTILAIFQQYRVDPKLYSVIFGESILNDAVSIVMYETLSQFHGADIHILSIFHGLGIFLLSFSSSMAMGVLFGLACSLVLKHSSLSLFPAIESCLVALVAYTSYFFSNGLHMSGIVSLLFCGITLKHYAYHTMSRRTQRTTKYLFLVLAQLSENFIFIYLGLSLFTQEIQVFKLLFIVVTLIAVVATRYLAVFPLSGIINWIHRLRGQRHEELPHSYQMMLFWAGLRGAVGVALASGFSGPNRDALRTTVLVVVVLTVILFGGTTSRMLEVMRIRTGIDDEGGNSSTDEEERIWLRSGRLGTAGARWDVPSNARYRGSDNYERGVVNLRSPTQRHHPHSHHRQNSLRGGLQPSRTFDPTSEDDFDSDGGDVLPLSRGGVGNTNTTPRANRGRHSRTGSTSVAPHIEAMTVRAGSSSPASTGSPTRGVGSLREAGEAWFQALDQRYLLPLFSNATASRTFHAKRATRRAAGLVGSTPGESGTRVGEGMGGVTVEFDEDDEESGRNSPIDGPAGGGALRHQEFVRSMNSFWRGSPVDGPRGLAENRDRDRDRDRGSGEAGRGSPRP